MFQRMYPKKQKFRKFNKLYLATDSSRGCTRRSRSSGSSTSCTRASGTDSSEDVPEEAEVPEMAVPDSGGSGSASSYTRAKNGYQQKFNKLNQNQSESESEAARHTVLQTANEELSDGEIPNDEERVPYSSAGPSNAFWNPSKRRR
jgi:hypothetical protein